RAADPSFARSVLRRWQNDFPEATAPAELLAKLPHANSAAELETLRLAKHREQLLKGTGQELELLRLYGDFLLLTYRAQRSAVFVPPSTDLQAALRRLIEVDPLNWRIYQLRLAELAWDRSDDPACFQLAKTALEPESGGGGRINFALEPRLAAL